MKTAIRFVFFGMCLCLLLWAVGETQAAPPAGEDGADDHCTDIIVGKLASVDGSAIVSHTGCGPECRVHIIPALTFPQGARAAVHYGIQDVRKPLEDHGEVLGYIPQVEKTYAYFHSAYPQMNEHGLSIGESTLSQRAELQIDVAMGVKQIMTIEQAQVFALQRCTKAREAVELIGGLMEKYGFLPSCGPESEGICITDGNEVWVMEVFSVGPFWEPDSGKPGAIWAAQRVPDDHVAVIPNWSIIKEIDLSKPDWFLASPNYMQEAVDRGWYDPKSDGHFIWQEVYSPVPREWAVSRFWLFFTTFAPRHSDWPDKRLHNPYSGYDAYHQFIEPLSLYPFSVKPEKLPVAEDPCILFSGTYENIVYSPVP